MSRRLRKRKTANVLAMYFAENGILNFREYRAAADRPVRVSTIKTQFNSYNKMLAVLQTWEPELYEMAIGDDGVAALAAAQEMKDALAHAEALAAAAQAAQDEDE